MAFKLVVLSAVLALASAGVVPAHYPAAQYAAAPAVAYQSYAAPVAKYAAAPAVAYQSYAAPVQHYAAPAAQYHAAPVVAKYAAPVQAYAAAPAYAKVAAPLAYAAPAVKAIDTDFDPNPQYSYAYDIHDALTGDVKSQHETREGDVVKGSYSFIESDGSRRTVEYTADDHNGFNAVVHKEAGVAKAVVAAPAYAHAAPAYAHAAPAYVAKAVAPVAYAAPAYKVAAPAYAQTAYAAPAYAQTAYAAPAYAQAAYAAPAYAKVAAPVAYASHAAPLGYHH